VRPSLDEIPEEKARPSLDEKPGPSPDEATPACLVVL